MHSLSTPKHAPERRTKLFAAGAMLFLTLVFGGNILRTVPNSEFRSFQADSQALVEIKIYELALGETVTSGGFLRRQDEYANQGINRDATIIQRDNTSRYNSQFGLQGLVSALFARSMPLSPKSAITALEWLAAASSALVLTWFLCILFTRYGGVGAVIATFLFAFIPIVVMYGRNLYWVPALLFLPYVIALHFYPRAYTAKKIFPALVGAIFAAVFVKCLCGYEFITCIVLAPTVVALGFGIASKQTLRTIATHCTILAAAAVLAFVLALATHLTFLSISLGGIDQAAAVVSERAFSNTINKAAIAPEPALIKYSSGVSGIILLVMRYLTLGAIDIGIYPGELEKGYYLLRASFGGLTAIALGLSATLIMRRSRLDVGMGISLLFSLLASVSWIISARVHSLHHFHLATIVFIIPFVLQLCVSFSTLIRTDRVSSSLTFTTNERLAAQKEAT
ncbi:MAG: hypothetical protein EOP84_02035 [Verrucomicrobiaceae bacterium]|nr:MAG: hypothetical protein EOP84_02035 [Verrucomicrobiaceae bacterium]